MLSIGLYLYQNSVSEFSAVSKLCCMPLLNVYVFRWWSGYETILVDQWRREFLRKSSERHTASRPTMVMQPVRSVPLVSTRLMLIYLAFCWVEMLQEIDCIAFYSAEQIVVLIYCPYKCCGTMFFSTTTSWTSWSMSISSGVVSTPKSLTTSLKKAQNWQRRSSPHLHSKTSWRTQRKRNRKRRRTWW